MFRDMAEADQFQAGLHTTELLHGDHSCRRWTNERDYYFVNYYSGKKSYVRSAL